RSSTSRQSSSLATSSGNPIAPVERRRKRQKLRRRRQPDEGAKSSLPMSFLREEEICVCVSVQTAAIIMRRLPPCAPGAARRFNLFARQSHLLPRRQPRQRDQPHRLRWCCQMLARHHCSDTSCAFFWEPSWG